MERVSLAVQSLLIFFLMNKWWDSAAVVCRLARHWYAERDKRRQTLFPSPSLSLSLSLSFSLRAPLTNSLSVFNESRSDHLILIGWAAARVVFHGPPSNSEKMEPGPANKKRTAKQSDGGTGVHLSSVAINVNSHRGMMALY